MNLNLFEWPLVYGCSFSVCLTVLNTLKKPEPDRADAPKHKLFHSAGPAVGVEDFEAISLDKNLVLTAFSD